MKYVDMNDVAFDDDCVAFPGLGNCHGVVYCTTAGMFAYHAGGNARQSKGKAEGFSMFLKAHALGGSKGVCLYGLCPNGRYLNMEKNAHKVELSMIAGFLGFSGPIRGYRWDDTKLKWGTAYVEVRFNQGNPTFWVENYTGCHNTLGQNPAKCDHKFVRQRMVSIEEVQGCSCSTKGQVVTQANRQFQATGKFHTTRKL